MNTSIMTNWFQGPAYWMNHLANLSVFILFYLLFIPIDIIIGDHFHLLQSDIIWMLSTLPFFFVWVIYFSTRFHQWLIITALISTWILWLSHHWVWTYLSMEGINMVTYLFLASFKRSQALLLFYIWSNTWLSFLLLWVMSYDIMLQGGRWVTHFDHWLWSWILGFKLGWFPFNIWMASFYTQWSSSALTWLALFPKIPYLGLLEQFPIHHLDIWTLWIGFTWIHASLHLSSQTSIKGFFALSSFWNGAMLGWLALHHLALPYLIIYLWASWLFLYIIVKDQPIYYLHLILWFTMASLPPFQTFFMKLWVFYDLIIHHYIWLFIWLIIGLVRATSFYLQWSQKTFYNKKISINYIFSIMIFSMEFFCLFGWL